MSFSVATLPRIAHSSILIARGEPGESIVEAAISLGSTSSFFYAGRTTKQYRFDWDKQRAKHVLRCPVSLWNGKDGVGRDLLDQRNLVLPILVEVVLSEPAKKEPEEVEEVEEVEETLNADERPLEPEVASTTEETQPPPKKRGRPRKGDTA